jgi:DNA-binding CsgD family transcriptional regulator
MIDASLVQKDWLRGRGSQSRAIGDLINAAAGGTGGALLLHGVPGSGRTALLDHATDLARRHPAGFDVLAAKGLVEERDLPYAVLHRLLEPLADRIRELPERPARTLGRALAGEGCPEADRLVLCRAVLTLLGIAAGHRPIFCRIDDTPDIDPASWDVLGFVARRLAPYQVALLLAAEQPGGIGTLADVPALDLPPLDRQASLALLADLVPEGLSAAVAGTLAGLAHGNPQALTDLVTALTPAQRYGEEPLPAGVPADGVLGRTYRSRLSRLPAETRWLLLLAAADDDGLDQGDLLRAAGASGTDLSALAPAETEGLIRIDASRVVFPQPLVRTLVYAQAPVARRHAAHRLLAGISTAPAHRLRRAVHLAAAAVGPDEPLAIELEQAAAVATAGPEHPFAPAAVASPQAAAAALLERAAGLSAGPAQAAPRLLAAAGHAWRAGDPQRARGLLHRVRATGSDRDLRSRARLLGGEMALRAGAAHEALDELLRAADGLARTDPGLALDALLRAAEAICYTGDFHRYAELVGRVSALRRPGAPAAQRLACEYLLGAAATFAGRHREAAGPLRRALATAEEVTDVEGLTTAAAAALLVAADDDAGRLAQRAVAAARAAGDAPALSRALELLATAYFWTGSTDAARETARDGLRAARAGGQDNGAGNHRGMLAVLAAIRGERSVALRQVALIAGEPGRNRPWALGQWALAVLDLIDGRGTAAGARLHALARPRTGRGQLLVQVMATPYLVEGVARTAAATPAKRILAVFDHWVAGTGSPARRALSARCHALLAPRGSDAAEEGFREALRLHTLAGADFERARTELLFGRDLRRCRRPRDAREQLHRAAETFARLGLPVWAQQAAAELRAAGEPRMVPVGATAGVRPGAEQRQRVIGLPAAGGAPRSAAAPAAELTAQQLRIARLVVQGATNREVAARLHLSPRTVDHHMRNIFTRLGLRSRVDLVRALR